MAGIIKSQYEDDPAPIWELQDEALYRKNGKHVAAGQIEQALAPAAGTDVVNKNYVDSNAGAVSNVIEDVTLSGTSGTLTSTPTDVDRVMVWHEGFRLQRVASSPTSTQFTLSGTTIAVHSDLSGETLKLLYPTAASTTVVNALTSVAYPATGFTLSATPASDAQVILMFEGTRLMQVGSSPSSSEYTISGASVTTGVSVTADGQLVAIFTT